MKKLLAIFSILLIMVMGACESAPTPYDDNELQNKIVALQDNVDLLNEMFDSIVLYDDTDILTQIELIESQIEELENYDDSALQVKLLELETSQSALELRVTALETRLDNLVLLTGLNGVTSVYENQTQVDLSNPRLVQLSTTIQMLKDTFDKSKFPSYMVDEFDEYVPFDDVATKLKEKYFNDTTNGVNDIGYDTYSMGTKAIITYVFDTDYTINELVARSVLLIEELRLYEFYVLSCSELALQIHAQMGNYTETITIKIPLVVMINSGFTIELEGILSQDYEMEITSSMPIDKTTAQQYYDDYVLNKTFTGYVLNYE